MPSSRIWARAGAALVLSLGIPLLIPAQDEPTFRIDTRLVNLWVNVTDQHGAIVGALTKDDFKITEDGRIQEIAVFERQSEQPLALTLAIDTSESVKKDLLVEQDAAKKFARSLIRPQDRMRVLAFATFVDEVVPFTNQLGNIDRGLGRLRAGGGTALYDAIYLGSQGLASKSGRKVLVLLSDGDDTVKSTDYSQALEQALRAEVMIYSIIDVPIASSAGRDIGGEHALITLAEQTGGKSFYAEAGNLDKVFAQVSDDLRTQYLIGYYPRKQVPGLSFHRVSVTIPRAAPEAFNIRFRAGYYSDPPARSRD